jgi:transposase
VIPPKSNRMVQRAYDKELYKARHRMENCKLKQYRATATRYDKPPETFPPQSISPPQSFGSIEDRL